MKEITIKLLVPDDLVYDGDIVDIQPPKFHGGQSVFIRHNNNPATWIKHILSTPCLYYKTWARHTDNKSLISLPSWDYLVDHYTQPGRGLKRVSEEELVSEEDHRKLLQESVGSEGMTLLDIAYLVFEFGIEVPKSDIDQMKEFLDSRDKIYEDTNADIALKFYYAAHENEAALMPVR